MKPITIIFIILISSVSFSQVSLDWSIYSSSNNPQNNDLWSSAAVDLQGNCYVTGWQDKKFRTTKYSSTGFEVWVNENNQGYSSSGVANVYDKFNNLYACGISAFSGPNASDITLIKYNPVNGAVVWQKFYNDTAWSSDTPVKMRTDTLGNIYIGGYNRIYAPYDGDYLVLKYAPNGDLLWSKKFDLKIKDVSLNDVATDLKIDKDMNVYIYGYNSTTGYFGLAKHSAVAKFDKNGVFQWSNYFNTSTADSWVLPTDVEIDQQGNVYISGTRHTEQNGYYFYTVKFNSSGVKQWTILETGGNGPGNNLELDPIGNIIAVHTEYSNVRVSKYSPASMLIWTKLVPYPGWIYVLKTKQNGDIICGGYMGDERTVKVGLFKLNSIGATQWDVEYTGNGLMKVVYSMEFFNNVIYVAGGEELSAPNKNQGLTLKFIEDENRPLVKGDLNIPDKFELLQNYPNPFNPATNIYYSLPNDIHVKITLFDILGREAKVLIDEFKTAGNYNFRFDGTELASGVYFYKITAGNFTDIKKMMLVK